MQQRMPQFSCNDFNTLPLRKSHILMISSGGATLVYDLTLPPSQYDPEIALVSLSTMAIVLIMPVCALSRPSSRLSSVDG